MDLARLILDYLKVLLWPLVLLFALLFYGDQIVEILETRNVNAFGVSISGDLNSLSENYEQEISSLKKQIAELESDNKDQLINKLDRISGNVKQEISLMRTKITNPESGALIDKKQQAITAERQGFEAIVKGDIDQALARFAQAKELWPTYHNVVEIYRLLTNNARVLSGAGRDVPEQWAKVCGVILEKYSWGIPPDIRPVMERKAALSN